MFTIDNKYEFRNTVEQVQENKEKIANHYAVDRALANFGIKIVGTLASTADLPDPLTYTGDYGDGFAIGQPGAYDYYIYTRPDLNSGHPNNYWLNAGPISIVGPQGPQGEQGPKGDKGEASRWYTGSYPTNPNVGDMFLSTAGQVFQYMSDSTWMQVTTIIGPQGIQGIQGIQGEIGPIGPQGPKGETGDVGGFINIAGILDNTNQLPTPASIKNLSVAYLVGANRDLYIQVGETSDTAIWNNVGPFNAATLVTSGGVSQNVWDADTKVGFTDYATYNKAGIVQIANLQGLVVDGSGKVSVKRYSGGDPVGYLNNAKSGNDSSYLLAAPAINKLVKSGLAYADIGYDFPNGTSAKGNWTEEEKTAGRTTLDAGKKYYKHTVTTTDGGYGYIISTEGTAYNGIMAQATGAKIIKMCIMYTDGMVTEQFVIDGLYSSIKQLQSGGYQVSSPISVSADSFTEM